MGRRVSGSKTRVDRSAQKRGGLNEKREPEGQKGRKTILRLGGALPLYERKIATGVQASSSATKRGKAQPQTESSRWMKSDSKGGGDCEARSRFHREEKSARRAGRRGESRGVLTAHEKNGEDRIARRNL